MGIVSNIPPEYVLIAGICITTGLIVGYMIGTRRNGK